MKTSAARLASAAAALTVVAAGCALDSGNAVNVVVGYQSKTINTVTAGTLLRAQGYLEHRLADVTKRTGTKFHVVWEDYDTGAPITAQMVAEKIDIGSMGDYPMLINGSKTQANPRAATEIVSVTGYNAKGALNMVVVEPDSASTTLPDLAGKKISASVGSAGHGTLVRALTGAGINPTTGVEVLNQQPQVGASALESGQAQALSQFVAWPGSAGPPGQGQAALRRRRTELPDPARRGGPPRLRGRAPRCARRVPASPTRRDRFPQLQAAGSRADRRRVQWAAPGGRLPLQRPGRHRFRHHAQAVARRRTEKRCAIPEVDR